MALNPSNSSSLEKLALKGLTDETTSLLLFGDDDTEQLIFKAFRRDHEIQQQHLGGDLRQIVRVTQLGRYVESKVGVVFDDILPETNHVRTACVRILSERFFIIYTPPRGGIYPFKPIVNTSANPASCILNKTLVRLQRLFTWKTAKITKDGISS